MFKGEVIKLKQIHIWKDKNNRISAIKVTLSNGQQSPIFAGTNPKLGPSELTVRQDLDPYMIAMVTNPNACNAIKIQDRYDQQLCEWVGKNGNYKA